MTLLQNVKNLTNQPNPSNVALAWSNFPFVIDSSTVASTPNCFGKKEVTQIPIWRHSPIKRTQAKAAEIPYSATFCSTALIQSPTCKAVKRGCQNTRNLLLVGPLPIPKWASVRICSVPAPFTSGSYFFPPVVKWYINYDILSLRPPTH